MTSDQKTHVRSYVRNMKRRHFGETTPYAVGSTTSGNSTGAAKEIKVLPFDNVATFFEVKLLCKNIFKRLFYIPN